MLFLGEGNLTRNGVVLFLSVWICLSSGDERALVIFLCVGAILASLVGKVLKAIVNSARPPGSVLKDPGWPSTHTLAMSFFSTAFLVKRESLSIAVLPAVFAQALPALTVILAIVTAVHRVKTGLHTKQQVLGGAMVGTVLAALWTTEHVEALFFSNFSFLKN